MNTNVIRYTGWMSRGLGAAICCWAICVGTTAMGALTNVNEYSAERLATYCDKAREIGKLSARANVLGLTEMLLDEDPWVRGKAYRELNLMSNLSTICPEKWLTCNAWGKIEDIRKQVAAIRKCVIEEYGNKVHLRRTVEPQRKDRLTYVDFGFSEETIKTIEKRNTNEVLLHQLSGTAMHRLHQGEKGSVYILRALLDYESEKVQAAALRYLIRYTKPDLTPEGSEGLRPGKVDSKVLKEKKEEWVEWWEANEESFVPKKHPPLGVL